MSEHVCHAQGCEVPVLPEMLMCRRHWFMVPAGLRRRVWRAYRPGQEIDKMPSPAYLAVVREAINYVAGLER